jgi:UDP-GlcNAc:undecaprenyl-phosphate/decaprenyl-phosphate GlcNAc-1-phosphate transferase
MNLQNSPNLLFITVFWALLSLILSYSATVISKKFALKYKIVDDPSLEPERKKHKTPIPLLGGTGFVISTSLVISFLWLFNKLELFGIHEISFNLEPFKLFWIIISLAPLLIGGYLDDKYNLPRKYLFISITTSLLIAVFLGGLKIDTLSYPFNNLVPSYPLVPEILGFLWLGFCVAATKFLDGHDGLVGSVGIIALMSIASVSLFANVNQPLLFIMAVIWIFGVIGFLPFNFPEAKLYLGEGASEAIGFVIGSLAILSGAKIATSSAVIGWFILDIIFVMTLRKLKRRNIFSGDRLHWHFRLLDLGLNKIQVLAITINIILITAHLGLLIPTEDKIFVLFSQGFILSSLFLFTLYLGKINNKL